MDFHQELQLQVDYVGFDEVASLQGDGEGPGSGTAGGSPALACEAEIVDGEGLVSGSGFAGSSSSSTETFQSTWVVEGIDHTFQFDVLAIGETLGSYTGLTFTPDGSFGFPGSNNNQGPFIVSLANGSGPSTLTLLGTSQNFTSPIWGVEGYTLRGTTTESSGSDSREPGNIRYSSFTTKSYRYYEDQADNYVLVVTTDDSWDRYLVSCNNGIAQRERLDGGTQTSVGTVWLGQIDNNFLIDWGDGSQSIGAVAFNLGKPVIYGNHAYEWSDWGSSWNDSNNSTRTYSPRITNAPFANIPQVIVSDSLHYIHGDTTQTANFNGEVSLTGLYVFDSDPLSAQYEYSVEIDWGDGASSTGTLVPINGQPGDNLAIGSHDYSDVGVWNGAVRVRATDGTFFQSDLTFIVNQTSPVVPPTPLVEAPTNLLATLVSNTQVQLEWQDNATNETSYRVEAAVNGGEFQSLTWYPLNADSTRYLARNLQSGGTYQFRMIAFAGDASSASNIASIVTSTDLPTGVTLTPLTATSISVSWTIPNGDTSSYEVQRSSDSVNYIIAGTSGNGSTSFIATGLSSNSRYWFRLRIPGSSQFSPPVEATPVSPSTPGNLRGVFFSNSQIELQWTDNSTNETEFRVEISSNNGITFETRSVLLPNSTSVRFSGLIPGNSYCFRVIAIGNGWVSAPSNFFRCIAESNSPALQARTLTTRSVELQWAFPPGDISLLDIQRSEDQGATYTTVTTRETGPKWTDTGVGPNKDYLYRARVSTNSNTALFGTSVRASTMFAAPSGLSAIDIGNTSFILSWEDNTESETRQLVEISFDGGENYEALVVVAKDVESTPVWGLEPGSTFLIRLIAVSGSDRSDPSQPISVTTTQDLPTAITAIPVSPTEVAIRWQRLPGDTSPVIVEVNSQTTGSYFFGGENRSTESILVNGLEPATTYSFRLVLPIALPVYSASVSARTLIAAPYRPLDFNAEMTSGTTAVLTWLPSDGAAVYVIELQTEETQASSVIGTTTATWANVVDLRRGGYTYSYAVRALNIDGQASPISDSESVTTPNDAPVITAGPNASRPITEATSITLSAAAMDDGLLSDLMYSWSVIKSPGGEQPEFSINHSSPAASVTATFHEAGDYVFELVVTDKRGVSSTGTTNVKVNPKVTSLSIDQSELTVFPRKTRRFTASATDQFGHPTDAADISWRLANGLGTISNAGNYSAPESVFSSSSFTIEVSMGNLNATSTNSLRPSLGDEYIKLPYPYHDLEIEYPSNVILDSSNLAQDTFRVEDDFLGYIEWHDRTHGFQHGLDFTITYQFTNNEVVVGAGFDLALVFDSRYQVDNEPYCYLDFSDVWSRKNCDLTGFDGGLLSSSNDFGLRYSSLTIRTQRGDFKTSSYVPWQTSGFRESSHGGGRVYPLDINQRTEIPIGTTIQSISLQISKPEPNICPVGGWQSDFFTCDSSRRIDGTPEGEWVKGIWYPGPPATRFSQAFGFGIAAISRPNNVDLDIIKDGASISEKDETGSTDGDEQTSYGALILRNRDDDDLNGQDDYEDTTKTPSDDDLVVLKLTSGSGSSSSPTSSPEKIKLRVEGDEIRLWWQNSSGGLEAVTSTTEFNVGQDYILFAETGDSFDEAISIIAESTRFRGSGDDNLPGVDKITLGSINSFDVSANPTIDAASGIAEAIVYIPGTEEELEDIENEFVTFKLLDGSGAELSVAPIDIDRTKIKGGVAMVEFVVPNRRIQNGQTPRYQIKAEWRGDTIKSSTLKVIPGPPENIQFSGYVIKDGSRTDLSTVSDVSRYRDGMFSTTTSYVVIQGAVTDAVGNPVANGTPVEWGAFGTLSDSKFYTDLPENTETVDGRVWTRIAVNDIPPTTTISLNSDATEGRFPLFSGTYTIDLEAATNGYLWNTVTQTPQIDLQSPDAIWVTAYVRDRFGNSVPDNTPVTWKDSKGMIWSAEQVTLNGQARAKVEFALHGLLADASALGKDWITASVGPTNAVIAVDIIDSRPISLSLSRSMIGRIPDDATEIGPIDGFRSAKLKLQSSTLSPLENNFSQVEQDVVISEGAWLNVSGLEPGGSYRIRLENNGLGWVSLARNVNPGGGAYWQNLSSTSTFEFYAPANGRKSIRIDTTHINLPPLTDLQSRNKPISVRYVLEREGFIVNNSWSRVAAVGGGAGGITVASDLGVATRMKQAMLVYFDAYAGGLLGSDDLGAGLLGDVGISLIPVVGVYSDIRDLGKQLFRGAANAVGVNSFSRFSKIDAVIAAAGILTELPPLQPLDYVLDAMRVSRKLIKTAPIFAPLATLLEPLFLRVVEGLWDAYFQGNVPPNGGGYGSISAAGFGGANPINAMGAGAGRGTVDDIGVMIDRFLSGKLKAGDKESLIGWVKTLKATATGVLTGNRSLYDSLTALMRTIESGKVAKSLDHLVAKFGKENESLMEIIVKARAKAGNDEDFARGIVALAKSLETPKALKSKLSSVEKAAATRKINEFAKTLANDPELAAAIVFKLGKIENNAANVAGQGHRVISISLGEALGSAIATGTLASTKSMDEFTNDLAFLFDRLRTNPSDTSNKILLKKINDNFKAMEAPGAPQSRQGVIQGRALELSGIAALVRKHNQDLVLNREILNYPTHLQPTDADIFSKLISRGSTVIGAESKFSKAALVSARSFARKVIAYKRELGDHGIFYLVVPAPAGLWQQAVEKLTQRRAQLHGNATEAHYIDEALRYLTKVSDKSRATGLGGEMTVGRLY